MYVFRLNGARLRQEYQRKLEAENLIRGGGKPGVSGRDHGGFHVTVEGVTVSGPLETIGEIRAAMEQDWRSADIGGEAIVERADVNKRPSQ